MLYDNIIKLTSEHIFESEVSYKIPESIIHNKRDKITVPYQVIITESSIKTNQNMTNEKLLAKQDRIQMPIIVQKSILCIYYFKIVFS